jgi:phenylacetate-coenzyme A ligase PaaK-like adenylate-forming protein
MRLGYAWKRLQDKLRAARLLRSYAAHSRWSPDELKRHQRERLRALLAHALEKSPFYAELYRKSGVDADSPLEDLPVVDKKTLMANFDRVVTDPGLKLAELRAHLARLERDEYYRGEYRVFSSSGTTGHEGIFVYGREEWSLVLAARLLTGSLGERALFGPLAGGGRTALIVAHRASSASVASAATLDVFGSRYLFLDAALRVDELAARLNAARPRGLVGGSSLIALLAEEQLAGRLRIAPRVVVVGAELATENMKRRILDAWGVRPSEAFGMTECPSFGLSCAAEPGIHVREDLGILEVVGADGAPVPDGTPGRRILLTNLYNRTQPLIRYEISDVVAMAPDPCPCGSPFRRIAELSGRSEDVFVLPGPDGRTVSIPPAQLRAVAGGFPRLVQYQFVQDEGALVVLLVVSGGRDAEREIAETLRARLNGMLLAHGAAVPELSFRFVAQLEREPGGKIKLIKSNVAAARR